MIKAIDIQKRYQMGPVYVDALKGITFTIKDGDMVAIMGPSGSGKSTIMNIIGCLDRPTSGTYELNGTNVEGLSDDALAEIRNRHIGFVFQQFHLLPRISLLQNVELPLLYAGVPVRERRKKAEDALEVVGLADRMHHNPNEVSGGQKQRAAIARALVNEPSLILADEPTGNLDSKSGAVIMELFTKLNHMGKTVILVTHDPEICEYAHRVIRLKDGILISDETRTLVKRDGDAIEPIGHTQNSLQESKR